MTKSQESALKAFPSPEMIHDRTVYRFGYEQAFIDISENMIDVSISESSGSHWLTSKEPGDFYQLLSKFKKGDKLKLIVLKSEDYEKFVLKIYKR